MSLFAKRYFKRFCFSQIAKDRKFCAGVELKPEAGEIAPSKDNENSSLHRRKRRQCFGGLEARHVYPEFLPDPEFKHRNATREKLERMDMLNRRTQIDIPEFYVGSVLAVTYGDPHNQGKNNKFVGICIERGGPMLRAYFLLRNVVDHIAVEMKFMMYDPTIERIQVLRLEKRLDGCLHYLRDAPPEYSTFSFDMEPEILPEGTAVPVNPAVVPVMSRPWHARLERKDFKGVEDLDKHLTPKMMKQRDAQKQPWVKYDLMKTYRATIPEEEQNEIWSEVYSQLHLMEVQRKKHARKKVIVLPKKSG